jgi:uracil phosphoribosyltransferase
MQNLVPLKHPLVQHHLQILRNKNSSSDAFRDSAKKLTGFLFFKATENLPTEPIEIETPICKTVARVINNKKKIFLVPILRAGLVMSSVAEEIIPNTIIQHIGMYRDEKTHEPVWYYNKLPGSFEKPEDIIVYICDPMLATGGSAHATVKLYVDKGINEKNITFISIISAPEGIKKLFDSFPNITIITAAVDDRLNENAFIVPGLGDAGDRINNTIY